MRLFTEMTELVTVGQYLDMRIASAPLYDLEGQLDAIRATMRAKTASYTAEFPLAMGASAALGDGSHVAAARAAGLPAGIAFQLRDDLLGVFGRQELTGKSTRSDLDGRKLTPLMSFALASSHGPALRALLAHAPLDDESADRVRAILVESGARAYVEQLIDENVRRAIQQAELAPIPRRLRGELRLAALEAGERER